MYMLHPANDGHTLLMMANKPEHSADLIGRVYASYDNGMFGEVSYPSLIHSVSNPDSSAASRTISTETQYCYEVSMSVVLCNCMYSCPYTCGCTCICVRL